MFYFIRINEDTFEKAEAYRNKQRNFIPPLHNPARVNEKPIPPLKPIANETTQSNEASNANDSDIQTNNIAIVQESSAGETLTNETANEVESQENLIANDLDTIETSSNEFNEIENSSVVTEFDSAGEIVNSVIPVVVANMNDQPHDVLVETPEAKRILPTVRLDRSDFAAIGNLLQRIDNENSSQSDSNQNNENASGSERSVVESDSNRMDENASGGEFSEDEETGTAEVVI